MFNSFVFFINLWCAEDSVSLDLIYRVLVFITDCFILIVTNDVQFSYSKKHFHHVVFLNFFYFSSH